MITDLSTERITAMNISQSFYLQDGGKKQLAYVWNKITSLSPYVWLGSGQMAAVMFFLGEQVRGADVRGSNILGFYIRGRGTETARNYERRIETAACIHGCDRRLDAIYARVKRRRREDEMTDRLFLPTNRLPFQSEPVETSLSNSATNCVVCPTIISLSASAAVLAYSASAGQLYRAKITTFAASRDNRDEIYVRRREGCGGGGGEENVFAALRTVSPTCWSELFDHCSLILPKKMKSSNAVCHAGGR